MSSLRDRTLLLRRFPYGESSLVCHALTREHGRVHLLAKGAYRPTSRYFAALDLFDTLELEWNHSPTRELQLLQAASIETRRHRIAHDLERYRAGSTVLELAALGAPEGHASEGLFDLSEVALDALAAERSPLATLVEFELGFLRELGLAPALELCATCGGPAPALDSEGEPSPRAAFSAGSGGRLCRSCATQARALGRRVGTLPVQVLELGAEILEHPGRAEASSESELELVRDFAARFLEYHLEGRPKSYRDFLATPNRNRP